MFELQEVEQMKINELAERVYQRIKLTHPMVERDEYFREADKHLESNLTLSGIMERTQRSNRTNSTLNMLCAAVVFASSILFFLGGRS